MAGGSRRCCCGVCCCFADCCRCSRARPTAACCRSGEAAAALLEAFSSDRTAVADAMSVFCRLPSWSALPRHICAWLLTASRMRSIHDAVCTVVHPHPAFSHNLHPDLPAPAAQIPHWSTAA